MDYQELLNWAFERHLNPLSGYVRPIFLILYAYFAYKRNVWGIVASLLLLVTSMVWFPAPDMADPQALAVLEYEKQLFSSPLSAVLTILTIVGSMAMIGVIFWKRSLKLGLIVLNAALIIKLVLSVLAVGQDGWGPLPVIVFGLVLVNGVGWLIVRRKKKQVQH